MKEILKAVKISEKVYWVGAIDWNIRNFHGYATERGTTYNAFLILDEKITLIDTVKAPFKNELMARISSVIDPEKIEYIVSNHSEMDHTGSLPEIIKEVKPERVFASPMGEKNLKAHFGDDLDIEIVKTGDSISLGDNSLSFVETKMLHWPDSMLTYLDGEKILFSQDAFGMHLAGTKLYADEYEPYIIDWEAKKYFANILMLYATKILPLLDGLPDLNLDIAMIAPDHGPLWRQDLNFILDKYREWSNQEPKKEAVIIYDTMWQSTAYMAKPIADGLRDTGINVDVMCLQHTDRSQVVTKVLDAGIVAVGSPTLNNNILPTIADVLCYLRGLKPKNKLAIAFGSYGWSGEAVKQINEEFDKMKLDKFSDGLRIKYVPTEEDLKQCYDLGVELGKALIEKIAE
jgi:flavorubredoxin